MDPLGATDLRDKWEMERLSPISSSVSTLKVPRQFGHTGKTASKHQKSASQHVNHVIFHRCNKDTRPEESSFHGERLGVRDGKVTALRWGGGRGGTEGPPLPPGREEPQSQNLNSLFTGTQGRGVVGGGFK